MGEEESIGLTRVARVEVNGEIKKENEKTENNN
jgi:hypothetical protein